DHGDHLFAWRTKFNSFGATTQAANWTFIAQAMAGSTEIAPPGFRSVTHFSAGYLLAGIDLGAWRPALRVDAFTTRTEPPSDLSEHGNAVTFAELAAARLAASDRRSVARRQQARSAPRRRIVGASDRQPVPAQCATAVLATRR